MFYTFCTSSHTRRFVHAVNCGCCTSFQYYDDAIEAIAQKYAQVCRWAHDTNENRAVPGNNMCHRGSKYQ